MTKNRPEQEKEAKMTSKPVYVSPYERRVQLVANVLKGQSKLSAKECHALAVQVLHTLDTIPEKIR
jgi:Family of unknown function (DUF6307)